MAPSKKRRGAPSRADITFQLALIDGLDWLLAGKYARVDLIRAVAQANPSAEQAFHSALQAIARGTDALSIDEWSRIDLAARETAERESPKSNSQHRSPTGASRNAARVRALRKELLAQRRSRLSVPRLLAIDAQANALRQADWAARKSPRDGGDPALVVWELLTLQPDAELGAWCRDSREDLWPASGDGSNRTTFGYHFGRWVLG